MLQYFIPVMQNVLAVMIPLAMLMAFISKRPSEALRKWIRRGVVSGLIGAFAVAALRLSTSLVKREIYEGSVLFVALLAEVLLLFFFWRAYKRGYPAEEGSIPGKVVFTVVTALLLYRGLEFFLFPANFIMETMTVASADFGFKVLGMLLGFGLSLLTGVAIFRVTSTLPAGLLLIVASADFVVLMLQQAVVVTQVLLARGFIPMSKGLLAIMIPLINYQIWFLYAMLAITFALPVLLYLRRKPAKPEGLNPAQHRKNLAVARKQLRWGAVVALNLVLVMFISTVGKAYADQKVEISPAIPVAVEQNEVRIPLEKVEDGKLYRFAYQSSNGTVVRFIVIKKSGSAYGVGLDACEICGPTGYYERDGQVVCKLCDVVMNKATIGFKGGCNPVPLEFKIATGKIIIPAMVLEKEKGRFK